MILCWSPCNDLILDHEPCSLTLPLKLSSENRWGAKLVKGVSTFMVFIASPSWWCSSLHVYCPLYTHMMCRLCWLNHHGQNRKSPLHCHNILSTLFGAGCGLLHGLLAMGNITFSPYFTVCCVSLDTSCVPEQHTNSMERLDHLNGIKSWPTAKFDHQCHM